MAEPVFVDCEPATGNIDPTLLEEVLRDLRREGRRVAAVMPVDMFGTCADYSRITPVCAAAEVPIVEDAAEALGATHVGQGAGSFGRGRRNLLQRQQDHHNLRRWGPSRTTPIWSAAAGICRRLNDMMARRRRLRERYARLFAPVPGVRLLADDDGANCWLTTIVVDQSAAGWEAGELAARLAAQDVETRPVWTPMHLQPVFASKRSGLTGAAERLFADGLTLPSGSGMTESQVLRVVSESNSSSKPNDGNGRGAVELEVWNARRRADAHRWLAVHRMWAPGRCSPTPPSSALLDRRVVG